MRPFLVFLFILACLVLSSAAKAEPVPEFALQKDYQNCMGEDTPQTNPEHASYCKCVIDKMREWDLDTYGEVASEQAKDPTNTAKVSPKIGDIAKACLAQAFSAK